MRRFAQQTARRGLRAAAGCGLMMLGAVVASCWPATPASASGLWVGGIGSPFFYGGLSPYGFNSLAVTSVVTPIGFGYPAVVRPVVVARPVIAPVVSPVVTPVITPVVTPLYRPRPAVAVPLNRAYRRAWRRGW